jgi:hypothetical protein
MLVLRSSFFCLYNALSPRSFFDWAITDTENLGENRWVLQTQNFSRGLCLYNSTHYCQLGYKYASQAVQHHTSTASSMVNIFSLYLIVSQLEEILFAIKVPIS